MIRTATSEFLDRIERPAVYRAIADAAYARYLATAGKRLFIDKTPRYWMVLEFLESVYPSAPRILLMRNPYAIAASLKSTWGIPIQSASCPSAIGSCLADIARGQPTPAIASTIADLVLGLPALAAQRGHPYTRPVQYELLVTRPDEVIGRLIAGLGYDRALTALAMEQMDYLRSSNFGDRKILERKAIDDRSVDAWKTVLSPEEMQAVTDLVGAELLIEIGYEKELGYAQKAGVVDRGRGVAEHYRRLFQTSWDLLGGTRGTSFGISIGSEPNTAIEQAGAKSSTPGMSSGVTEPQHIAQSSIDDTLRQVNSMVAELERALEVSKSDPNEPR